MKRLFILVLFLLIPAWLVGQTEYGPPLAKTTTDILNEQHQGLEWVAEWVNDDSLLIGGYPATDSITTKGIPMDNVNGIFVHSTQANDSVNYSIYYEIRTRHTGWAQPYDDSRGVALQDSVAAVDGQWQFFSLKADDYITMGDSIRFKLVNTYKHDRSTGSTHTIHMKRMD